MGYLNANHLTYDLGLLAHVASSVDLVTRTMAKVLKPVAKLVIEAIRAQQLPMSMYVRRSTILVLYLVTVHSSDGLEAPPPGYVNPALPRVSDEELCGSAKGKNTSCLGSLRRKRAKWEENNGQIPAPRIPSRLNSLSGYNRYCDLVLRLAIKGDNIVNIIANDVSHRRYNLPSAESSVRISFLEHRSATLMLLIVFRRCRHTSCQIGPLRSRADSCTRRRRRSGLPSSDPRSRTRRIGSIPGTKRSGISLKLR